MKTSQIHCYTPVWVTFAKSKEPSCFRKLFVDSLKNMAIPFMFSIDLSCECLPSLQYQNCNKEPKRNEGKAEITCF